MAIEGYVDSADSSSIAGWAYDDSSPDAAVTVEVLVGGVVVATVVADGFRADLQAAGKGNGRHAFVHRADGPVAAGMTARVAGKRWRLPPGGPVPVPGRFQAQLSHTLEFGFPDVRVAFTEPTPFAGETEIVRRLIDAYHNAISTNGEAGPGLDVWTRVASQYHAELADLLRRKKAGRIAAYLGDAHGKGVTFGITQGLDATAAFRSREDARGLERTRIIDGIVSLAESLGLMDVESSEQRGDWGDNLHADVEELVGSIGAAVGVAVVPPVVIGSLFGVKTAGGVLSGRDVQALYAATRLRSVAENAGLLRPTVCEIGGGLGGVAYYVSAMGFARNFTVIDLPVVNALQGYYLMRTLGAPSVRLYGEPVTGKARVSILPPAGFESDGSDVDLLFNMDSMPEMHPNHAIGYLERAKARSVRQFLSINQEARAPHPDHVRQTVVREIVRRVGGFKTVYRFKHWVRPSYVEELFQTDSAVPANEGTGPATRF